MNQITFKQLRYFEALARHQHFGRAADACAVSQPALSVQIKELEDHLGMQLFERGPRQVRLTGFGEAFAGRARVALQSVEELDDLARMWRDRLAGRLRVGVIPTIAPYMLPSFVGLLDKHHPGLDIHIRETQTAQLVRELHDGRLDCAILALPIAEPSFEEVVLVEEEFVLIRPMSEADVPIPPSDQLLGAGLLLLEEGHCFRDQAMEFCNVPATMPPRGLDGSTLSTLVQMVSAGLGVTLIPEMAVPIETRSAQVALSRFQGKTPKRVIGMVWRKSSPMSELLRQVEAAAREAMS